MHLMLSSRSLWVSLGAALVLFSWLLPLHADAIAVPAQASSSVTAFLCADSGEFSGAHELGFLQNALESRETLSLSPCQSAYRGTIRHADGVQTVPVLVVTTGIGYVSAALCTRRVLNWENSSGVRLDKFVWIGTSGFSPMLGGWNPTNTSVFRHEEATLEALQAALEADQASHPAMDPAMEPPSSASSSKLPPMSLTAEAYAAHMNATASSSHASPSPLLLRNVHFEMFESEMTLDADGCAPRVVASSASVSPTNPVSAKTVAAAAGLASTQRDGFAELVSIGSLCVTSSAFLQESAYCTETPETTQCSRPHCYGFERETINRYVFDDAFAKDIMAASAGKSFPAVPAAVREGMGQFWFANEAVVMAAAAAETESSSASSEVQTAGESSREEVVREAVAMHAETLTPRFVPCAESTMNAIFVGAERDYLCREHTAHVLNLVEARFHASSSSSSSKTSSPHRHTPDTVACVQAMEAFGFLQSMSTHAPERRVAILRTASNYDMYPQQKLYLSEAHVQRLSRADRDAAAAAESSVRAPNKTRDVDADKKGAGQLDWVPLGLQTRAALDAANMSSSATSTVSAYVWSQNTGYVSKADYDAFVHASFHYSVRTAAFVISNYFFGGRDFYSGH